jgi:transcriptional regulator with XRE-family HTH domain
MIIADSMKSPFDMAIEIAKKVQEKRLKRNLTQQTLSEKSGVSYGTLKKFEQKGQISLESLLKLAMALGELNTFEHLFDRGDDALPSSLDELLDDKSRKRGRK